MLPRSSITMVAMEGVDVILNRCRRDRSARSVSILTCSFFYSPEWYYIVTMML